MAAAKHNLIISRGADFGFRLTIRDLELEIVDVSADTFTAQIRRANKQPLVASFTCESLPDGVNGVVNCILPKSESLKLDGNISYKWDLFRQIDGGVADRLIYGDVKVEDNITYI